MTTPVSPNPSPEVVALLDFLSHLSGEKTLTGQHCPPLLGSSRLSVVHRYTGDYPALFGQDFGFSFPGYWDGINYRQRIVDEAIRRHQEGFIITLMWHAVPPTMDEPVRFESGIQSALTEAEWTELVTPGSHLHERWKAQVDVIAWFLKQLRYARVPVLWRPYHEMNGGWFWWGQWPGDQGYKQLYRMLFERLTAFHGLNNLLWVYNTNEIRSGVHDHSRYFPGHDVVDVLATDVYKSGFARRDYKQLLTLAEGKPIALGEVGDLPTERLLKRQPHWAWFMPWFDPQPDIRTLYQSDCFLRHSQLPWVDRPPPTLHHPVLR